MWIKMWIVRAPTGTVGHRANEKKKRRNNTMKFIIVVDVARLATVLALLELMR